MNLGLTVTNPAIPGNTSVLSLMSVYTNADSTNTSPIIPANLTNLNLIVDSVESIDVSNKLNVNVTEVMLYLYNISNSYIYI